MRIVLALGGNALVAWDEPLEFDHQRRAAARAAELLAPIAAANEVVITHGASPQIGLLALQGAAYPEVGAYPLDALVAESAGMIGYVLENELDRVIDRQLVTVLTRTVVDPHDPAFAWPSKAIGPMYYDEEKAQELADRFGWALTHENGGVRRVVASPEPLAVIQAPLIRRLMDMGVTVICGGGGGAPVVADDGMVEGIEAVVDKDLVASLLAVQLDANRFVCLTDVPAVVQGWGTELAVGIRRAGCRDLREMVFEPRTMAPKVEAACRFVEATGRTAAIGSLETAELVVAGVAGTQVEPSPGLEFYPSLD
jgi:carbamate kinase